MNDDLPANDVPQPALFQSPARRVWIEKTIVRGRLDRQQGPHRLGQALWSPQRGKGNRDIYANMRDVQPGDLVLHLTNNEGFTGISQVAASVDDTFRGVEGTDWGDRPGYRIALRDFQVLSPPLTRNMFLGDPEMADRLRAISNEPRGRGLFYNERLELNQGGYLTEAPAALVEALNASYRKHIGRAFPHLSGRPEDEPGEASASDELEAALLQAARPDSRRLVARVRPPPAGAAADAWLCRGEMEAGSILQSDDTALMQALKPGDAIIAIHDNGQTIALGIVSEAEVPKDFKVVVRWRTSSLPRQLSPQPAWRSHAICEAPRHLIPLLLMTRSVSPVEEPAFSQIVERVRAAGLLIEERLLRRYHAGVRARGFAVLAGLSGAGKTWLTRAYADAVGARYLLCAVAPNWTGPEDLLGYLNPLTGAFQPTAFTSFLEEAAREWEVAEVEGRSPRAYHLLLDEMNLARVEHYFARFLSVMEVRAHAPDGCADVELYPGCAARLTPNLRFVGTVNVDETTHGFSDKVFDRAQLVKMETPRALIAARLGDVPHAAALLTVWDAVERTAPFAFRVVDDMAAYIRQAQSAGASWQEALDEQVLQKVLPKLRGSDPRMGATLQALLDACADMPLSRAQAVAMAERFAAHGFVSFF